MLPLNYYLMLHLHIALQQHVLDRGTAQLPFLPVTGSKNKYGGLAPPSSSSTTSFPHSPSSNLYGRLRGLHYISSGRGASLLPGKSLGIRTEDRHMH
jgi:hypothetical protein